MYSIYISVMNLHACREAELAKQVEERQNNRNPSNLGPARSSSGAGALMLGTMAHERLQLLLLEELEGLVSRLRSAGVGGGAIPVPVPGVEDAEGVAARVSLLFGPELFDILPPRLVGALEGYGGTLAPLSPTAAEVVAAWLRERGRAPTSTPVERPAAGRVEMLRRLIETQLPGVRMHVRTTVDRVERKGCGRKVAELVRQARQGRISQANFDLAMLQLQQVRVHGFPPTTATPDARQPKSGSKSSWEHWAALGASERPVMEVAARQHHWAMVTRSMGRPGGDTHPNVAAALKLRLLQQAAVKLELMNARREREQAAESQAEPPAWLQGRVFAGLVVVLAVLAWSLQAAGWVWLHRLRLGLPATALLTQASEPLLLPLHSLAAALLPARHAEALVWLVLALVQVVLYVAVAAAAARQVVGSQPLAWEALTRAVQAFLGVGREPVRRRNHTVYCRVLSSGLTPTPTRSCTPSDWRTAATQLAQLRRRTQDERQTQYVTAARATIMAAASATAPPQAQAARAAQAVQVAAQEKEREEGPTERAVATTAAVAVLSLHGLRDWPVAPPAQPAAVVVQSWKPHTAAEPLLARREREQAAESQAEPPAWLQGRVFAGLVVVLAVLAWSLQAAGWVWLHRLRLGLPATALLTQASEPLLLPLHSLAAALLPARHAEALVWLVLALVQVVLYVAVAAAAARQVVGSQPLAWEALTRAVQAFLGVGREPVRRRNHTVYCRVLSSGLTPTPTRSCTPSDWRTAATQLAQLRRRTQDERQTQYVTAARATIMAAASATAPPQAQAARAAQAVQVAAQEKEREEGPTERAVATTAAVAVLSLHGLRDWPVAPPAQPAAVVVQSWKPHTARSTLASRFPPVPFPLTVAEAATSAAARHAAAGGMFAEVGAAAAAAGGGGGAVAPRSMFESDGDDDDWNADSDDWGAGSSDGAPATPDQHTRGPISDPGFRPDGRSQAGVNCPPKAGPLQALLAARPLELSRHLGPALVAAAASNRGAAVEALIAAGADVGGADGAAALKEAAYQGHLGVLQQLLAAGGARLVASGGVRAALQLAMQT
eukprot:XP_001695092.1 predicted protein [Chlamydomonas reinhardtii]